MRRNWKRILSLLLTAAMIFTMNTNVLADTVSVNSEAQTEGSEVTDPPAAEEGAQAVQPDAQTAENPKPAVTEEPAGEKSTVTENGGEPEEQAKADTPEGEKETAAETSPSENAGVSENSGASENEAEEVEEGASNGSAASLAHFTYVDTIYSGNMESGISMDRVISMDKINAEALNNVIGWQVMFNDEYASNEYVDIWDQTIPEYKYKDGKWVFENEYEHKYHLVFTDANDNYNLIAGEKAEEFQANECVTTGCVAGAEHVGGDLTVYLSGNALNDSGNPNGGLDIKLFADDEKKSAGFFIDHNMPAPFASLGKFRYADANCYSTEGSTSAYVRAPYAQGAYRETYEDIYLDVNDDYPKTIVSINSSITEPAPGQDDGDYKKYDADYIKIFRTSMAPKELIDTSMYPEGLMGFRTGDGEHPYRLASNMLNSSISPVVISVNDFTYRIKPDQVRDASYMGKKLDENYSYCSVSTDELLSTKFLVSYEVWDDAKGKFDDGSRLGLMRVEIPDKTKNADVLEKDFAGLLISSNSYGVPVDHIGIQTAAFTDKDGKTGISGNIGGPKIDHAYETKTAHWVEGLSPNTAYYPATRFVILGDDGSECFLYEDEGVLCLYFPSNWYISENSVKTYFDEGYFSIDNIGRDSAKATAGVPKGLFSEDILNHINYNIAQSDDEDGKLYRFQVAVMSGNKGPTDKDWKTVAFKGEVYDDDLVYFYAKLDKDNGLSSGGKFTAYVRLISKNETAPVFYACSGTFYTVDSYAPRLSAEELVAYRDDRAFGDYLNTDLIVNINQDSRSTRLTSAHIRLDPEEDENDREYIKKWGWTPEEPSFSTDEYCGFAFDFYIDNGDVKLNGKNIAFNITNPSTGENLLKDKFKSGWVEGDNLHDYKGKGEEGEDIDIDGLRLTDLVDFWNIPEGGKVSVNMAVTDNDRRYFDVDERFDPADEMEEHPGDFTSFEMQIVPSLLYVSANDAEITDYRHWINEGDIRFSADASGLDYTGDVPVDVAVNIVSADQLEWFTVDGETLETKKAYKPGYHSLKMQDPKGNMHSILLREFDAFETFLSKNPGLEIAPYPDVEASMYVQPNAGDSVAFSLGSTAADIQYGANIADKAVDDEELEKAYKPSITLDGENILAKVTYRFTSKKSQADYIIDKARNNDYAAALVSFNNAMEGKALYEYPVGNGDVYVVAQAEIDTTSGNKISRYAMGTAKIVKRPVTVSFDGYVISENRYKWTDEGQYTISGANLECLRVTPDERSFSFHKGLDEDNRKGEKASSVKPLVVDTTIVNDDVDAGVEGLTLDISKKFALSNALKNNYAVAEAYVGYYVKPAYYLCVKASYGSKIYTDLNINDGDAIEIPQDETVYLSALLKDVQKELEAELKTDNAKLTDTELRFFGWEYSGDRIYNQNDDLPLNKEWDYFVDAVIESRIKAGDGGYDGIYARAIYDVEYDGRAHVSNETNLKGNETSKINDLNVEIWDSKLDPDPTGNKGVILEEGVDYTLSYKNNKEASVYYEEDEKGKISIKQLYTDLKKRPQVIVKGKGNYKSVNLVMYYNILPAYLSTVGTGGVKVTGLSHAYVGNNAGVATIKYKVRYTASFRKNQLGETKDKTVALKETDFGVSDRSKYKDFIPRLYKYDEAKGWVKDEFYAKNKVKIDDGTALYMLVLEGTGNYYGTWQKVVTFDKDPNASDKYQFYVIDKNDEDKLIRNYKISCKTSVKIDDWKKKGSVSPGDLDITVQSKVKGSAPLVYGRDYEVEFVDYSTEELIKGDIVDAGKYYVRIKALPTSETPVYGIVNKTVSVKGEKLKAKELEFVNNNPAYTGSFKTFDSGKAFDYDGYDMHLTVRPKSGSTMTISDDYKNKYWSPLSYNSFPGTYTVKVNGSGIYGHSSVDLKFKRNAIKLTDAEKQSLLVINENKDHKTETNINGAMPSVNIAYMGRTYGTDLSKILETEKGKVGLKIIDPSGNYVTVLTVQGQKNTGVGEAKFKITGDGNYFKGTLTKTFTIYPMEVKGEIRSVSDMYLSSTVMYSDIRNHIYAEITDVKSTDATDVVKAKVALYQVNHLMDGYKKLTDDKDFNAKIDSDGKVTITDGSKNTFKFTGAYLEPKALVYSDKPKLPKLTDAAMEKVTTSENLSDPEWYDIISEKGVCFFIGRMLRPEIKSITLDGGEKLINEKDYQLYYDSNIGSGTGTMHIRLLSDGPNAKGMGGTYSVKFKILQKGGTSDKIPIGFTE